MRNPLLNDKFILALIILNAVVIYIQCFDDQSRVINWIDMGFLICFLAEMGSKMYRDTFIGYWRDSWNRFDGTITLISSVSLLWLAFPQMECTSFEWLMTLRVLRIFRFFRLLRFIPSIQSIIAGTKRAIVSSYVIVFAFMVMAFIISVITCQLYGKVAPEYFGAPMTSLYTIFRLFTIEGWYDIPDTIASRSCYTYAALAKLYFVALLFFGGIIGMSFINSIIVDAMVSDNNDELIEQVKSLERKLDAIATMLDKQNPT